MKFLFRTFARRLPSQSPPKPADAAPTVSAPLAPSTQPSPDPIAPQPGLSKSWMASRNVFINSLPPALLTSAKSLFSSYPSPTIRDWGYRIAESYTKINSIEKPMDIRKLQPFATSIKTIEQETKAPQNRGFYKLPDESLNEKMKDLIKLQQSEEAEQKLPYQKEHAIGYAYKRMPNSYASIYRILHEVKHRLPEFRPEKCLDYGSGTGAAAWAACELFEDVQVTAIEPSKEMRTVGKKLSAKEPRIQWAESLANLASIANKDGMFDLVICGYVLSEIENPVTRNLILDALWQRTGGVMVFVEPGTPKGFRLIYSVREWCIKTMNRSEACIVAPCPHEGECPLAAHPKSWCHFSQFTAKYPKSVMSRVKGEENYENEKFSYIVVQRGPSPRYLRNEAELDLAQQSFLWPRFVRPTIRRKKHIVFDVCRVNKLERTILSKGKVYKDVYKFLRGARWGDLWPFKEGEYFNVEKRKMKYKKFRLRRKLRGKERKIYEKGESEGTDVEEERKAIEEKNKLAMGVEGKKERMDRKKVKSRKEKEAKGVEVEEQGEVVQKKDKGGKDKEGKGAEVERKKSKLERALEIETKGFVQKKKKIDETNTHKVIQGGGRKSKRSVTPKPTNNAVENDSN